MGEACIGTMLNMLVDEIPILEFIPWSIREILHDADVRGLRLLQFSKRFAMSA